MRGVRTTFLRLVAMAVFLAAALLVVPSAMADGKMFAVEIADVSGAQIPDQAAMICWDPKTKTETLAIETRFIGKGTEFGWVVPLPSRPDVKPGTKGMFPSLRGMFAPVVQTRGVGAAPIIIALIVVVLIFLYAPSWKGVAGLLLVLLFLAMVMLPALGTARAGGSGSPIAEPEFVDRRIVGDFEVTTLESPEGAVVVDWLRSHRFHVPAAAEKAIDQYAKEKWSFVATRLVRAADTAEPSTAHPLVFTFTSDAPVYPMRLTGADATRDLSVELFVFGPSRAGAKSFRANAAGDLFVAGQLEQPFRMRPSAKMVKVAHAAVGPLVESAKFATRLTATLKPTQMNEDVRIDWPGGGAIDRFVQSWQTAGGIGLDVGLAAMFIVLCVVGHYEEKRSLPRFTALRWGVIAALSLGVVTFAALPKVSSISPRESSRSARELASELRDAVSGATAPASMARVERVLEQLLRSRGAGEAGLPTRGDAPGQIELRILEGSIWLVTVGPSGVEEWHGIASAETDESP